MTYAVIKALHIIFVITWFAGLFYIFRLFVYHAEAARRIEPARSILTDQFLVMERRLWYYITWPSCILTLTFGIWMIVINPYLLEQPWLQLKLFFVVLLLIYQFYGQRIISRIKTDPLRYTSIKMRIWNEVPTILLVAIIFLVILHDTISWIWGLAGLLGIAALMMLVIMAYRKKRTS